MNFGMAFKTYQKMGGAFYQVFEKIAIIYYFLVFRAEVSQHLLVNKTNKTCS
jgi:hypothetical protein